MRKPNALQMTLLIAAHRNGGRLPSQSFAYFGVFAPYGGTEKIQAALAGAAKIRDDAAAERYLCDQLDTGALLMAGGFLDVKRDSFRDARGTLAERYVKAIRRGFIEHTDRDGWGETRKITTLTLRACIRAGWLTDRWHLTEDGYAAGRAVNNRAFRPLVEIEWRDTVYNRAVKMNAAAPHQGDAIDALIAEAHAEALSINHALYGLPGDPDPNEIPADRDDNGSTGPAPLAHIDPDREPYTFGQTGRGKSTLVMETLAESVRAVMPTVTVTVDEAAAALSQSTSTRARELMKTRTSQGRDARMIIMDPKPSRTQHPTRVQASKPRQHLTVAGAMAGYNPDDMTGPQRRAFERGVNPATFARLYPAVTLDDDSDLLRYARIARDALVRNLTELGMEPAVHTVLGDPREAGYRVSLHELRTNANLPERIRKGAFYLELGLTTASHNQAATAAENLRRAAVVLV